MSIGTLHKGDDDDDDDDDDMATEGGMSNATSTIHNGYYSKQITR